jgi:hypothetical protein
MVNSGIFMVNTYVKRTFDFNEGIHKINHIL